MFSENLFGMGETYLLFFLNHPINIQIVIVWNIVLEIPKVIYLTV